MIFIHLYELKQFLHVFNIVTGSYCLLKFSCPETFFCFKNEPVIAKTTLDVTQLPGFRGETMSAGKKPADV